MYSCRDIALILPVLLVLGLLMPGLSAKRISRQAVCADNLRLIYRTAQNYSSDHDGMIVPSFTSSERGRRTYWAEILLPYAQRVSEFYCPADPGGKRGLTAHDLLPIMFDVRYVSYGISYFISSTGKRANAALPYNINAVAKPSYVIYFGDAKILQLRPTRGCWLRDWNPVHRDRGANYVMADGHVEFFTGNNPGLYDRLTGWKQDRKRWKNWKKL